MLSGTARGRRCSSMTASLTAQAAGRDRRRRHRAARTHQQWHGGLGEDAITFLVGSKKAERGWRQSFDLVLLRHDNLLESLCALQSERVGGLRFGGGRVGLEIAPRALFGQ